MIVYYHGSPDKPPVETHTLICAPAGHLPGNFPLPDEGKKSSWWDMTGDRPKPSQIEVTFHYGEAEVADDLGKYLVSTGQAQKTRLILPNSWNR